MKLLVTAILLASAAVQAETSLSCKNTKNNREVLTARILNNKYLSEVDFDLQQYPLKDYFVNDETRVGNKVRTRVGFLTNPTGRLTPKEIENNRSPYKGSDEFAFKFGEYKSYLPPNKPDRTNYDARLILPNDLSNDNLKTFRFKSRKTQKVNGVLIMNPPRHVHQYGDNFLKLFCTSD
jgi:hypothetical protein